MNNNSNHHLKKQLKSIKNELINDDDITHAYDILHDNEHLLLKIENYANLNKKRSSLIEKIETLPDKYQKLFNECLSVNDDISWYDMYLLYLIGLKQGINVNNLLEE